MTRGQSTPSTRRDFLKAGSAAAVAGALAVDPGVATAAYAAGDDVLKVGLIGCGGRGSGAAAQALNADPNTKLVALGDTFEDQTNKAAARFRKAFGKRGSVDEEHRFVGFDAYKDVIRVSDVVLLATPPHFRPEHLKAAVEAGRHVFCEKPVAVDGPGCRSVAETVALAKKKKLSIVSGLCWRYHPTITATFEQVHDEQAIGEITAMRCSYNTRGLWKKPRQPGWSDMEWQVRNWLYFTWLSGDHIVEQHIHSLDKMVWAMNNARPVKCSGTGGRQTRTSKEYGHIFDHFAIEYEFPNGVMAFSRCRQQNGCKVDVSDDLFGTKGTCHIAGSRTRIRGDVNWTYKGRGGNMYQLEHNALFKSIRDGNPINNGDYMNTSTMMAVMGRVAAYTGQDVTWDQVWNSKTKLGPEKYIWGDIEVPPVAMPGITKFA